MAKPVDEQLPDEFHHIWLEVDDNDIVQPFPVSTPLRSGIWITLDNKDFRVAFAPGVLSVSGLRGMELRRSVKEVVFFPCADASLLLVQSTGNNGRINIMAG